MVKIWPYALGAFALFLGWQAYSAMLRRDGALHEQVRALETRNAALEDEAGRIDTVYRDSIVYRTKVKRVTDSILLTDTVFSRNAVTQIVKDERDACDAVIHTCEAQKANLRSQIANLDSTITVLNKQRPSWFTRTTGKLAWLGAGLAAGVLIK